ncbi:MAG: ABC transporter permease, partial [Alphaproteobacteria bacterium]
ILFLIASVTGLGTVGAVILSYLRLFNSRHQFLGDLLRAAK